MIIKYLILFICGFYLSNAFACEVVDDVGNKIVSDKPFERIISLAPDITEILFDIGASKKIVGVLAGSDFPEDAKKIEVVGSISGLDLERIILLKPDLIVTWNKTFLRQLAVLKKRGVAIYTTNPTQLEDVPRTMNHLGCLLGEEKRATFASSHFTEQLNQLRTTYQEKNKLSVFYQIGSLSLWTINRKSWINQVIELCGGKNIFANAKTIAPEVSLESVIQMNPDVILSDAKESNWQKPWLNWTKMSAVEHHNLFNIHPDLVDRAGPRLLLGANQICQDLDRARNQTIKPQLS